MSCAIIGAYRHNHRRGIYYLGTHSGFLEGADDEEIGKLIAWGNYFVKVKVEFNSSTYFDVTTSFTQTAC